MPMDIKRHVKTFRRPQGNSAVEDWCVESLSGRMFGLDVCVRRALTVNSQMEHTKCMRNIQEGLTNHIDSLKSKHRRQYVDLSRSYRIVLPSRLLDSHSLAKRTPYAFMQLYHITKNDLFFASFPLPSYMAVF